MEVKIKTKPKYKIFVQVIPFKKSSFFAMMWNVNGKRARCRTVGRRSGIVNRHRQSPQTEKGGCIRKSAVQQTTTKQLCAHQHITFSSPLSLRFHFFSGCVAAACCLPAKFLSSSRIPSPHFLRSTSTLH